MTNEQKLNLLNNFSTLTRSKLIKYFPETKQANSTKNMRVLLAIFNKPKMPKGQLKKLFNSGSATIDFNINSLIQLNYVKLIAKPRPIPKLNTWIIDDVYIITPTGKKVLQWVLNEVDTLSSN